LGRERFSVSRTFGTILPVLGLLGALLAAPRDARANSGNSFLETIGISIAVGTVLGVSTLPFYSQPGSHLSNLAYGAAAGAGAGLIYAIFTAGRSSEDQASLGPLPNGAVTQNQVQNFPNTNPRYWTPLVSLNW
jgi:hypothetical protein